MTKAELLKHVDARVSITVRDPDSAAKMLHYVGVLRYDDAADPADEGYFIVETEGPEEDVGPFVAADIRSVEQA